MNKQEQLDRLINGTRKTIWCPMCEQVKPLATISPWVFKGVLVCTYGLCFQCCDSMKDAPRKIVVRSMYTITSRLMEKYAKAKEKVEEIQRVKSDDNEPM